MLTSFSGLDQSAGLGACGEDFDRVGCCMGNRTLDCLETPDLSPLPAVGLRSSYPFHSRWARFTDCMSFGGNYISGIINSSV